MGYNFYEPKSCPRPFDIVWSKWPRREDKLDPGPWVRAVLVLDCRLMVDTRTGTEFTAVTAAYGTGKENVRDTDIGHLLIGDSEFRAAGLHKPTIFKLDVSNRMRLPWCEEYFVTQGYVRSQNVIAGALTEKQIMQVRECLAAMGLEYPLP